MKNNQNPDYYEMLQVHFLAEPEIIKAAYKRLAAKYHPDVNKYPEAEEIMKRINIAYSVLSDPVKRAEYDLNYRQKSNCRDSQGSNRDHKNNSRQTNEDENISNPDKKEPSVKPSVFRLNLAHFILIFFSIGAILCYFFLLNISDEEKLFKAIKKGDTLTISRLADKDPNLIKYGKNKQGKSPLEYAADTEQLDAARILREKGAPYSVSKEEFFKAVTDGDIRQVKRFIALGADVNAKNDVTINGSNFYGWTPLHKSVYEGHTDISELLINEGAYVNAKDNDGWTPLSWAAENENTALSELLITKGADVNAKDNTGETPLHWATAMGSTAIAESLISKGADVNAKDNNGFTPLHWAVAEGQNAMAELLVNEGADVNAKENAGCTPLHFAVVSGMTAMAELLITKGADVNAKENNGWTPLHLAATNGRRAIAELLISKGADVNAKENHGFTPLFISKFNIDEIIFSNYTNNFIIYIINAERVAVIGIVII